MFRKSITQKLRRESVEMPEAHVHDVRGVDINGAERHVDAGRDVPRDVAYGRGVAAHDDSDAQSDRDFSRHRDVRHGNDAHAGALKKFRLLTAAPKHKRVAAFQAHDDGARLSTMDNAASGYRYGSQRTTWRASSSEAIASGGYYREVASATGTKTDEDGCVVESNWRHVVRSAASVAAHSCAMGRSCLSGPNGGSIWKLTRSRYSTQ